MSFTHLVLHKVLVCEICNGSYPENKHDFKKCESIDIKWEEVRRTTDFSLLYEPNVLEWFNGKHIEDEIKWGKYIETKFNKKKKLEENNNQWTTFFCEEVVYLLLILNGFTPMKQPYIETWGSRNSSVKKSHHRPDLETEHYIWEVKGRNYTTNGTAGEKIYGVPDKYIDIPQMTNKRVIIVCCGYQEVEARSRFNMFGGGSPHKQMLMEMYEQIGFTYIGCSDLLKIIIS